MSITAHQITLIQSTFMLLFDDIDLVTSTFYSRLFEQNPQYRHMFKGDMESQGRKLAKQLLAIVNHLQNPQTLVAATAELGKRHATYGVKKEDYAAVGSALLWTLAQSMGEKFTPEVEQAWTAAYNTLASIATEAAEEAQPEIVPVAL